MTPTFPFVHNSSRKCVCGQGGIKGKEQDHRTRTEIIRECTWTCPRCGRKFGKGIVSRRPIQTNGA